MARFINLIKSICDAVKRKTSEFTDWTLGYVPESIKKPISEKVKAFKQQVSDIFKKRHPHSF